MLPLCILWWNTSNSCGQHSMLFTWFQYFIPCLAPVDSCIFVVLKERNSWCNIVLSGTVG